MAFPTELFHFQLFEYLEEGVTPCPSTRLCDGKLKSWTWDQSVLLCRVSGIASSTQNISEPKNDGISLSRRRGGLVLP